MTTTPPPSDPQQPDDGSLPSFPSEGQNPPGQYPAGQYPPPNAGAPVAAPTQPASIATAVKLMFAGGAISILSLVIGLATLGSQKDEIRESVLETTPDASQATIDAAYTVSIVFIVIFGALGAALWFWMAIKNGQGRSWARVVATVLGALNILFTVLGLATGQQQQSIVMVLNIVNLLIAIGALVFLWRKESTDYYNAVTQSRQLR